jgi:mannan endo-1,4-beta-mannosidase
MMFSLSRRRALVSAVTGFAVSLLSVFSLSGCGGKSVPGGIGGNAAVTRATDTYSVSGTQILKNGSPLFVRGVNVMNIFGGDTSDMADWNVKVVRQPIDMKVTTLTKMQQIVDNARANGKITILAAFWYDNNAISGGTTPYPQCQLLGVNPSSDSRWEAVKTRWRDIANQFKNQPDVWFDVWNEPYWYNDTNGFSEDLWLSDMKALADNIRGTGATNIIVVPGSKTGQGETVIVNKGPSLLSGRSNIVFSIHLYGQWLNDSQSQIESRIQAVLNKNLALMATEIGVEGGGYLYNPNAGLNALLGKNISTMGWYWKRKSSEKNALLDDNGNPNNNNNNNWGTTYKNFLSATPPGSGNTYSGTWAAKCTQTGSWKSLYQVKSVSSNTTYRARFWLKGSGSITLRVYGGNWSSELKRQSFTASSTWQERYVDVSSGSHTQLTFVLSDTGSGNAVAYVDDCFLGVSGGTNLLSNAGFESGNTGWTYNNPPFTIVQNP